MIGEDRQPPAKKAKSGSKKEGKEKKGRRSRAPTATFKSFALALKLSPFHLHRVFLSVTSLTPGDFNRGAQVLSLQDALGLDSLRERQAAAASVPRDFASTKVLSLKTPELPHLNLDQWSVAKARASLGGVLPSDYSQGCLSVSSLVYTSAETQWGKVSIAFVEDSDKVILNSSSSVPSGSVANVFASSSYDSSFGSSNFGSGSPDAPPPTGSVYLPAPTPLKKSPKRASKGGMASISSEAGVFAIISGEDSEERVLARFPNISPCTTTRNSDWLKAKVAALFSNSEREVQLPQRSITTVRRVKLWKNLKSELQPESEGPGSGRKKEGSGQKKNLKLAGDEEQEQDFDQDEEYDD